MFSWAGLIFFNNWPSDPSLYAYPKYTYSIKIKQWVWSSMGIMLSMSHIHILPAKPLIRHVWQITRGGHFGPWGIQLLLFYGIGKQTNPSSRKHHATSVTAPSDTRKYNNNTKTAAATIEIVFTVYSWPTCEKSHWLYDMWHLYCTHGSAYSECRWNSSAFDSKPKTVD